MINPEQLRPGEEMWESVIRFAQFGIDGVNNFSLEGPINMPTEYHTAIAIDRNESIFQLSLSKEQEYNDALKLYDRVLKIEIPERIKRLQIQSSVGLATELKNLVGLIGMPYIVLLFGETLDRKEEVVSLFSVSGIKPEDGLNKIKERIPERKAKFN